MRDRERGGVLEDEETGDLREAYSQIKRAANAAGYHTAETAVQVALIQAHAMLSCAGSLISAVERLTDELRRSRKGMGYS